MTPTLPVRPESPGEDILRRAGEALIRGEAVALPTDTVYGLCVRAHDARAVERLFRLKGRTEAKGAPVLIGHRDQLAGLAEIPSQRARGLIETLWPASLTLILPPRGNLSPLLLGEDGCGIGVRLPDQNLCQMLALVAGPIAATSANAPGEPPLRGAAAIRTQFGEGLALILDGGEAGGDLPSTVVDARGERPVLLREGAVRFAAVVRAWDKMG